MNRWCRSELILDSITERSISGFHQDGDSDWVAELDCGHNQHVRHKPPMQWREWVLDPAGRAERLGSALDCPLCDRAELPEAVRWARTASWDEESLPAGLRRAHRVGAGTWGRISVQSGRLRFKAATSPPIERVLEPGLVQAIPPGVEHEVQPDGPVTFSLEFLAVDRAIAVPSEQGGDPACWAGLVCPECGGVRGDGTGHRPGCSSSAG
ncbi:MAG TPA: DUF3565 domain-containing protein [Acidimicrobiales bacterium]|nr:DUF3565 domain-containing protein [Acidimicrobiales bacterium]